MNLALIYRDFAHWYTATSIRRALEALGVSFVYYNNNDLFQNKRTLASHSHALVLDDGFGIGAIPHLPKKTAFWGADFHCGFEAHYQANIGQFAILYAAQYTLGVELLKKHGLESTWLPLAYDDIGMGVYAHPRASWLYDAHLVCSWSTDRRKRLRSFIEQTYPGRAFTAESYREVLGEAYYQSKVGLNDFGLNTDGRVRADHVNQRTFEAMGAGTMLLTPYLVVPDLDMIFPMPGDFMVRWSSIGDCLDKLDFYIKHDDLRERIALAGMKRVLAAETYKDRVKCILADLESL